MTRLLFSLIAWRVLLFPLEIPVRAYGAFWRWAEKTGHVKRGRWG